MSKNSNIVKDLVGLKAALDIAETKELQEKQLRLVKQNADEARVAREEAQEMASQRFEAEEAHRQEQKQALGELASEQREFRAKQEKDQERVKRLAAIETIEKRDLKIRHEHLPFVEDISISKSISLEKAAETFRDEMVTWGTECLLPGKESDLENIVLQVRGAYPRLNLSTYAARTILDEAVERKTHYREILREKSEEQEKEWANEELSFQKELSEIRKSLEDLRKSTTSIASFADPILNGARQFTQNIGLINKASLLVMPFIAIFAAYSFFKSDSILTILCIAFFFCAIAYQVLLKFAYINVSEEFRKHIPSSQHKNYANFINTYSDPSLKWTEPVKEKYVRVITALSYGKELWEKAENQLPVLTALLKLNNGALIFNTILANEEFRNMTLLMRSAKIGTRHSLIVATLLKDAGADLNFKNTEGQDALLIAIANADHQYDFMFAQSIQMIEFLVQFRTSVENKPLMAPTIEKPLRRSEDGRKIEIFLRRYLRGVNTRSAA